VNYSAGRYNAELATTTQANLDAASPSTANMPAHAVNPPKLENTSSATAHDTTPTDIVSKKASHQLFLPTILGTQKGISALSDFIQASGAFTRPNAPITTTAPTFDMEPTPSLDDDDRSEPGD
jgi:hypothetical protein